MVPSNPSPLEWPILRPQATRFTVVSCATHKDRDPRALVGSLEARHARWFVEQQPTEPPFRLPQQEQPYQSEQQ